MEIASTGILERQKLRCYTERGFLEFHHVLPFAEGGETTSANLQLRCRAHNVYEAERHFRLLPLREEQGDYELGPDRVAARPEDVRAEALGLRAPPLGN